MSALGQKQTCAAQKGMSALPPKADMCSATRDVRFGQKADVAICRQEFVTDRCAKLIALKKTVTLQKKESCRGPVPTGCDFCRAMPQTEHRVSPPPSHGQDRLES